MNSVSKAALGAALALGAASLATPALAQQASAQAQPAPRQPKFSKEERAALLPVQTAVTAKDFAAAATALAAAQPALQSPDARYFGAQFQLQIGLETKNTQLQAQAIDAMIASGWAEPAQLVQLYRNQGILAAGAGDRVKAETAFTRLAEASPGNAEVLVDLAKVKNDLKKPQEAVQLLDRAIGIKRAAGQQAPESWYKYALKLAYDGKMGPQSIKLSRDLLAAYPTDQNWRDALLIYRDSTTLDTMGHIDLLRLMRASGSLAGERDYYEMAHALNDGGFPGEAKAILDEGVSKRAIDSKKAVFSELIGLVGKRAAGDRATLAAEAAKAATAANGSLALKIGDAYYGYGDYAKAAELYRTALQKGSVDANLVNTRLGMALALGGQRAEAETAFRAVTGPRADLASYWMTWLSRRG